MFAEFVPLDDIGRLKEKLGRFFREKAESAEKRFSEVLSLLPEEELEKLKDVRLLSQHMKDSFEALRFFAFAYELTSPDPNEGYVILTLVRSKGLKEKFGFKGSDHKLGLRWIPAYHSWKRMGLHFLSTIVQESLRADYGINVYWKYGDKGSYFPFISSTRAFAFL